MKHTKGKKFGLMIFMLAIFALIPITSVIAEAVKMGDPTIEYVSSQLRVPEDMQKLPANDTVTDAVFYLDVVLQATKRMAANVNGTLSFKDDLRDYGMANGHQLNRNLSITNDFSIWADMNSKESKTTTAPFVIKGLNSVPEKITFRLELSTINPNDGKEYSKTIEFDVTTFQTEIDIIRISDPWDNYKGYHVPISIFIKNVGSFSTFGYLYIQVKIKSIEAGETGDKYDNFISGQTRALELTDIKSFIAIIQPLETEHIQFNIDFSDYSNGAMNIGEWKITHVYVNAVNAYDTVDEDDSDFNQHITNPYYRILKRPKSMQPHPVFVYYMWNSGGSGDDWGGTNPLPWIIDGNGDGSVSAGLWRFNTYDSNIPVRFNMIICVDDSTWDIPSTLSDSRNILTNGKNHVANVLNMVGTTWIRSSSYLKRRNCGFDILLMAAGRSATYAAGLGPENSAIVCKSGPATLNIDWKKNIDGLAQHEVSHLFGCLDYNPPDGHPKTDCIMFYNWWKNCIYEVSWNAFNKVQTPYWCNHCQTIFDTNWDRFDFYYS